MSEEQNGTASTADTQLTLTQVDIEMIKRAYEKNMKPLYKGGCPPCCACCEVIIKLAESKELIK